MLRRYHCDQHIWRFVLENIIINANGWIVRFQTIAKLLEQGEQILGPVYMSSTPLY